MMATISVELTYGLERLAMALQDVDNVFELYSVPSGRTVVISTSWSGNWR